MKIAINQAFIQEDSEDSDFKAQMRVLEQETYREDAIAKIEEIDEEFAIAHSAQIISIFTNNQKLAGYADELSVDFISDLITQGLTQDELENIIDHILVSASVNIAKDKSSAKKQMAKVFELLAVLERTTKLSKNSEQLQNSLRQMQEKLRDLAKGANIENIQKFLKEGELKTAIKQGAEVAAKNPETFRNAAADVATRIRESQQNAAQQQAQQGLRVSERQNLIAANLDLSGRNLAQSSLQKQVLPQSQVVLNSSLTSNIQSQNSALISSLQVRPSMQQAISQQAITNPVQPVEQTRQTNVQSTVEMKVEPKPEVRQEFRPIEAKAEVKTDLKPSEKTDDKPPTKGHVHSGDCCGKNDSKSLEQKRTEATAKTISDDIIRATNKEITPEERATLKTYASGGAARSTEAKYLQNTTAQSQQQAKDAFGYN